MVAVTGDVIIWGHHMDQQSQQYQHEHGVRAPTNIQTDRVEGPTGPVGESGISHSNINKTSWASKKDKYRGCTINNRSNRCGRK